MGIIKAKSRIKNRDLTFAESPRTLLQQTTVKSLQENVDTTTSGGKLVFHIFGALAEFEREIIRERTLAGLRSARSRGRAGGRPKALTPKEVQVLRNVPSYAGRVSEAG